MKKVLCDKDGKFLSIHDEDCTLTKLEDGDCLTHEDGTIMIYRERKCKEDISKAFYHVYLRNNELHFLKTGMSFSYYDFIPSFRFSTEEEKERMYKVLSENNLYYDEKEKCFKKLRWRAKISNSYYYIDWNRFVICKTTEEENESDNLRYKNLNYFHTKEEAYTKLFAVKSVLND